MIRIYVPNVIDIAAPTYEHAVDLLNRVARLTPETYDLPEDWPVPVGAAVVPTPPQAPQASARGQAQSRARRRGEWRRGRGSGVAGTLQSEVRQALHVSARRFARREDESAGIAGGAR